ncbi:hypothetical protein [Virgisporangium aliadipatigenens]|uniref:hypothetical protein n=1 Tax=Virgisporangium aliadipatigenens TaxID=741659 RepID=UPI0019456310|nr:hypothetical protein [Virgisporangium aliadipatigenens]
MKPAPSAPPGRCGVTDPGGRSADERDHGGGLVAPAGELSPSPLVRVGGRFLEEYWGESSNPRP